MYIALLLLLLSFSVCLLFPFQLRKFYIFVISSRLVVILLNLFFGLPGGNKDAAYFFEAAKMQEPLCQSSIEGYSFIKCLIAGNLSIKLIHKSVQFFTLDGSYFASHCLSLLISSLAVYFLFKTYNLFSCYNQRSAAILILIYGLMPSLATNQSYVLRECFQSFSIIYLLFCTSKYILQGNLTLKHKIGSFLMSIFSLSLHPIFFFISPLIITSPFLFVYSGDLFNIDKIRKNYKLYLFSILSLLCLLTLLLLFFNFAKEHFYMLRYLLKYGLLGFISKFLQGSISEATNANAQYGVFFNSENIFSVFSSLLVYLTAPIGFSARPVDLILYFEKSFIFICLAKYFFNRRSNLKKGSFREVRVLDNMIFCWFFVSLIFSLGTTNWGTAARHQVITFPLVLIPFIFAVFNQKRHFHTLS